MQHRRRPRATCSPRHVFAWVLPTPPPFSALWALWPTGGALLTHAPFARRDTGLNYRKFKKLAKSLGIRANQALC